MLPGSILRIDPRNSKNCSLSSRYCKQKSSGVVKTIQRGNLVSISSQSRISPYLALFFPCSSARSKCTSHRPDAARAWAMPSVQGRRPKIPPRGYIRASYLSLLKGAYGVGLFHDVQASANLGSVRSSFKPRGLISSPSKTRRIWGRFLVLRGS
jgi:hypothetical protein